MINLQGVCKSYSVNGVSKDALKDVTLSIEEKQKVCITGPSGAGKTTLFKLICCFDVPTQGKVSVAGQDLSHLAKFRLGQMAKLSSFRQQIAYVPQTPMLLPHLSVFENLMLAFQSIKSLNYEQASVHVRSALQQVQMQNYAHTLPNSLSLGQQQLVAFARAIAKSPKILIADEPTGNLDPELSREVLKKLQEINEQSQTTVLIATHDEALLQELLVGRDFRHYELKGGRLANTHLGKL